MKNLALHILDIAQNSITAGASKVYIIIEETISDHHLSISIRDNGLGMSEDMLRKVTDPYTTSRTTRKVGLGIPLFKQSAEQTEGQFEISSIPNKGTTTTAVYNTNHPDIPPWGDLPGVIILLVNANPLLEFSYLHRTKKGEYSFNTEEIKQELHDIPITHPDIRAFLQEMIIENLENIGAWQSFDYQKKQQTTQ